MFDMEHIFTFFRRDGWTRLSTTYPFRGSGIHHSLWDQIGVICPMALADYERTLAKPVSMLEGA